jgi:hypothetical protein
VRVRPKADSGYRRRLILNYRSPASSAPGFLAPNSISTPFPTVDANAAAARQWRVKQVLHLLGEREIEYQPFTSYGCGPLLGSLLTSQGLDPTPFLSRRLDAHMLLNLEDSYLRERLGMDPADVFKVGRCRGGIQMWLL